MDRMLAVLLAALTGPDGQTIWVNPGEVVSVRSPRESAEGHFAPQTRCLLQTADGRVVAVAEECEAVKAKLEIER